jgi:dihydroorotate dehydrogenase (fumarate)
MSQLLLNTVVAGIKLDNYILNASGPKCTSKHELTSLLNSESAAVMTKSCTLEPRNGNPEPRYKTLPHGSIQSMGLPNLGYKAYLEMLPCLKEGDKPIFISISGLSVNDNVEMVTGFQNSDADLLEVNFSCPNIPGKAQLGYDFDQMDNALKLISGLGNKPLGIKLPAYFDFCHFEIVSEILINHKVDFVTSINSIGNTLVIDPHTQTPVIKPKGGFGGLCGSYIKPIGLANVNTFRKLLPNNISIMGVGGISSGMDAFEYLLAGADAVQVATCYEEEGINCFTRISQELKTILSAKRYSDISKAKGDLKYL